MNASSTLLEEILLFTGEIKKAFNKKGFHESEMQGFRSLLLCALDQSERYANSILLLSENGLHMEASPLLRTFFEFYISIKVLNEDRSLTRRFAAFSWVRLKELMRYWRPKKSSKLMPMIPNSLSPGEIEAGYKKAMDEFNFTSREYWFPSTRPDRDPNLRDICKKLGELDIYDLVYRRLSDISHANVMSLSAYDFRRDTGLLTFSRVDSSEGYEAMVASHLTLMILGLFNGEFQLGLDSSLKSCVARLQTPL